MFIEILFKIVLFKGGVLIYAEHCTCIYFRKIGYVYILNIFIYNINDMTI